MIKPTLKKKKPVLPKRKRNVPHGKKRTIGLALDLIDDFVNDKEVAVLFQKNKKWKEAQKSLQYLKHISSEKVKSLMVCNGFPSIPI